MKLSTGLLCLCGAGKALYQRRDAGEVLTFFSERGSFSLLSSLSALIAIRPSLSLFFASLFSTFSFPTVLTSLMC